MAAAISIRGISRRFGDHLALCPVDLEIASGAFVAFIGPSGCGKTTLLRIVADLEAPSTGTVMIGADTAADARRQRKLGLVSQRPAVLPWMSAEADVRFTQRVAGRAGFRPLDLLRDFGLAPHAHKRPAALSGGMLQRVNIASAIAHDPEVLLMDEPFSALDEMKREELGAWFAAELASRPKTVLFVTHHIDEAALLADRLVVFSPGPGRVMEVIEVAAPRPRGADFRQDPRFLAATARARALLFGHGLAA